MENTKNKSTKSTIKKMKEEMKLYTDFHGGALNSSRIDGAKSKIELYEIIKDHEDFIIDMHTDALGHLGRFSKRIGLNSEHDEMD